MKADTEVLANMSKLTYGPENVDLYSVLAWLSERLAPEGYEDGNGFHQGRIDEEARSMALPANEEPWRCDPEPELNGGSTDYLLEDDYSD